LSASQLADKFKNLPGVLEVSPNNIDTCVGDSSVVPNDPDFAQQWGLDDIGAEQAWGVTTGAVAAGSKEPVIAVIDTGVDYTHPDLEANIWSDPASGVHGLNAYSGNDDPQDENGHGTHVAGITAAVGNNGVGVAGVSWSAKIMPLRFMDASGSGTDSAAIQCIDYAIDEKVSHGVDVVAINASWGASGGYDAVMADAIQAAGNAGIIFVAAAGNNGTDNGLEPFYPACYPCSNIISVGASDSSDVPASFSNYGATSVDLFAPGVNVISTFPPGMDLPDSNVPSNGYATLSGTSMATPFVSGAIALLATVSPSDSLTTRMNRVLQTVDPETSMTGMCVTGGRLDLAKAVESCVSISGVAPASGYTPGGTSVVISGRNLTDVSQVTFGGVAASYKVNSSTQITATTPAHAPGKVAVAVTADGVTSADLGSATEFTYKSLSRYEQTDPRIAYAGTWTVWNTGYASGGSCKYSNLTGASVTVNFTGTYLSWIGIKGPLYGIASVSVDGGTAQSVDLYSPSSVFKTSVWNTGTLASGTHTVKITWTGTKNPSATNTYIGVDAFDVVGSLISSTRYEQSDSRLAYAGTWTVWNTGYASGNSCNYSNLYGASVTVNFTGTYLSWIGIKGPLYGIASVSLDGGTAQLVDLYSPTSVFRTSVWNTGTLASGTHTVTITWTGTKNPSATNTYVGVDGFDVVGTLN
jgi:subtilisin family serine protease